MIVKSKCCIHSEAQKYLRKVDQINRMTNCKSTENFNQLARSLLVVASTPPTKGYEKFTEQVRNYSSMPPFNFTVPQLFSQSKFSKVREKETERERESLDI